MTILHFTNSELALNRSDFINVLNEKRIPSLISAGQPPHEARKEFFRLALKQWNQYHDDLTSQARRKAEENARRKSEEQAMITSRFNNQSVNKEDIPHNTYLNKEYNSVITHRTGRPDRNNRYLYNNEYSPIPIINPPQTITHPEIQKFLKKNLQPSINPVLNISSHGRQHEDISNHFNNIRHLFFKDFTVIEQFFNNNFDSNNQFLLPFIYPKNPYFHHHLTLFDSTLVNSQNLISYYSLIVEHIEYEFQGIYNTYQIDDSINVILKHLFFKIFVANLHIKHLEFSHNQFFQENPHSINNRVPVFLFDQIKNHLNFLTGLAYEPFKFSEKEQKSNLWDLLQLITNSYNQFNNFKTFNYTSLLFLTNNAHKIQEIELKKSSNSLFIMDETSHETPDYNLEIDTPTFDIPSIEAITEQQFKFFH